MVHSRHNSGAFNSEFRVVPASALDDAAWQQWTDILQSNPALHSPFLRPEFVQCVASTRPDVHIAQGEIRGEPAFFAFHRRRRVALALGFGLAEWQAVVTPTPSAVDWPELLRQLQVSALHFDHLYAWQLGDVPQAIQGSSPYLDLSGGFEQYLRRRKTLGDSLLQQTRRKCRKLEREHGLVELEYNAPIDEALECLFRWKSKQHVRTGVRDAFADRNITELLTCVANCRSETFCGRISWLKCGGRPIAVHLGVETPRAAHMWYPAYDPGWSKYSPGNILFLRLAGAMAEAGIERFDFGPGGQAYKERFSTDAEAVTRGVFDSHRLGAWMRQQSEWARRIGAGAKRRLVASFRPVMPVRSKP